MTARRVVEREGFERLWFGSLPTTVQHSGLSPAPQLLFVDDVIDCKFSPLRLTRKAHNYFGEFSLEHEVWDKRLKQPPSLISDHLPSVHQRPLRLSCTLGAVSNTEAGHVAEEPDQTRVAVRDHHESTHAPLAALALCSSTLRALNRDDAFTINHRCYVSASDGLHCNNVLLARDTLIVSFWMLMHGAMP